MFVYRTEEGRVLVTPKDGEDMLVAGDSFEECERAIQEIAKNSPTGTTTGDFMYHWKLTEHEALILGRLCVSHKSRPAELLRGLLLEEYDLENDDKVDYNIEEQTE